jgi:hypothetical protein
MKNTHKKLFILGLLGTAILCGIALFGDIGIIGGAGLAFAFPAAGIKGGTSVQGLQEAHKEGAAEILREDIDVKIREYTKTVNPVSNLATEFKPKRKSDAIMVKFGYVREKPLEGVITAAVSGGTSPTVNITIRNEDFSIFAKMGTVIIGSEEDAIPSYNEDNTPNLIIPLTGIITGVDDATSTLRVQCNNGFKISGTPTFKDAIPVGAKIYRMSTAETEYAVKTTPFSLVPSEQYNYCQNMIASLMASDWSELHEKQMNWSLSDQARMSLFDRARTKEGSYLFGTRRLTQINGENVYMCGGLYSYITKSKQLAPGATESDLYELMFEAFSGNNGDNTRFLFMGSEKYRQITNIPKIQKQIDSGNSVYSIFGLEFDRIDYNGWKLYLYNHYMFDAYGRTNQGLLLDFNNIEERCFISGKETKMDLKKLREAAAMSIDYQEVSCLQVYNPDTHMIVY